MWVTKRLRAFRDCIIAYNRADEEYLSLSVLFIIFLPNLELCESKGYFSKSLVHWSILKWEDASNWLTSARYSQPVLDILTEFSTFFLTPTGRVTMIIDKYLYGQNQNCLFNLGSVLNKVNGFKVTKSSFSRRHLLSYNFDYSSMWFLHAFTLSYSLSITMWKLISTTNLTRIKDFINDWFRKCPGLWLISRSRLFVSFNTYT